MQIVERASINVGQTSLLYPLFLIESKLAENDRGGAVNVPRPLVVQGWSSIGLPHHQQFSHTLYGDTSLPGWGLPFQYVLPLSQGELCSLTCFALSVQGRS